MNFEQYYIEVTTQSQVFPSVDYVRILWSNAYTIDQAVHNLKTMHDK